MMISVLFVPRFIKKMENIETNDAEINRYHNLYRSEQDTSKPPSDLRLRYTIHAILIGSIGLITIIASIIYLFSIGDILQHIFIPEYSAAQEVITTLSK